MTSSVENNNVVFSDLSRIHLPLENEFKDVLECAIKNNSFINGKEVEMFEETYARWVGVDHCVGTSSGFMASVIALQCLSQENRRKVIIPAMTFVATVEAIIHAGLEPEVVDVTKEGLIDLDQVEDILKRNGPMIVCPVHLYGKMVESDPLDFLSSKYESMIFEDACQAHGAQKNGRKAGSVGEASAFSFYPGKNLGALGDGGALCTDHKDIMKRAKALREHGQVEKNHYRYCGYTARLDAIQAGFLNIKMRYINGWIDQRIAAAKYYIERLQDIKGIEFQSIVLDGSHVYHLFVVKLKKREELIKRFEASKIQYGLHYPVAIHQMECYRSYHWSKKSLPLAEQYASQGISLPIFPEITKEEMDKVVEAVRNSLSNGK